MNNPSLKRDDAAAEELDAALTSSCILAEQGTLELVPLMTLTGRLNAAGLRDKAVALYRLWLEHTASPLAYVACFNLGVELDAAREYAQAEAMYRRVLEQNPGLIQARLNLGNSLEQQKREDEALEQWRLVSECNGIDQPENRSFQLYALNNLGRLLESKRRFLGALEVLEKSFAIDPTQRDVLIHLVHLFQKVCKWPIYHPPQGITKEEMLSGTSPLAILAASDDPQLQLSAARKFVEYKFSVSSSEPLASRAGYRHQKIRIGYLSSDFCLHAVSLLTVQLLELHDREQFEVYGFCWSREDGTAMRKRVVEAMDRHVRVEGMSDREAAECIRSHEIDILIDLQGLTSGARPLILSYRPATVQMTYLGFPGTTALPWVDYVIADRYLIPEELVPYHSEKPLYLPNCFQASDSKREVGLMPLRADNGLPENAFVFCSFNNNCKFTPELFAVWMQILKRVPGSVLWLLADNEWARENLCRAAKEQGIEGDRLIFSPRVAPADYLARYQLADLFLDTFPFNGGTTANDALWMGLPLLTLSGRTFASRMAGSLLTDLGLPELITTSLEKYQEAAVGLARDPARLGMLRSRLKEGKLKGKTFDIPALVKDYEAALATALRGNGAGSAAPGPTSGKAREVSVQPRPVTHGDLLNLLALIRPWHMANEVKIRVGSEAGGYVLPACAARTNLVLSVGSGAEAGFDGELAALGASILQFDRSQERAPLEQAKVRLVRQGWGARDSADERLLSLGSMMALADWSGASCPILKFDSGGAEWEALQAAASGQLERFEIIVGRFHDFQHLLDRGYFDRVNAVFAKLARTHKVVHLHGSNAGGFVMVGGIPFPRTLEISYLKTGCAVFTGHSAEPIPGPLDRPNLPHLPDLYLRAF